jgi:hypothetical protein
MNLTSNPLTNTNDNDKNIKDPEYFGNGEF